MRQDALDYRRFEDGGDDLELTTAVRAVLQVDLEHALEQPGRAQLMRAGRPCAQLGSIAVSSDLPGACSGSCGTTMARSLAFGASTPWKRIRCSLGRGTGA